MVKRKTLNRKTMTYKTVHRKIKIYQHRGKIRYFRRLSCSCSTSDTWCITHVKIRYFRWL